MVRPDIFNYGDQVPNSDPWDDGPRPTYQPPIGPVGNSDPWDNSTSIEDTVAAILAEADLSGLGGFLGGPQGEPSDGGASSFDFMAAKDLKAAAAYATSVSGGAAPTGSSGGSSGGGGAPASGGFVQNYINESIAPLIGLRGTYDSQEAALMSSLMEKYGLARTSQATDNRLSGSEIGASADETAAVIEELMASQDTRQTGLAQAATDATSSVNETRLARQAQLLAAIEAGGGDAGQVGSALIQSDTAVSREQSANATALAATQASGKNQLGRASSRTSTIEQSAMSTLANNYRKASDTLDQNELAARTTVEQDFAQKRTELEFNIAQATVQAKREAEQELQRRKEAAARASAASNKDSGLSMAGAHIYADSLNVPVEQVLAAWEAGAGAFNAFVAKHSDLVEGAEKDGREASAAADTTRGLVDALGAEKYWELYGEGGTETQGLIAATRIDENSAYADVIAANQARGAAYDEAIRTGLHHAAAMEYANQQVPQNSAGLIGRLDPNASFLQTR